MNPPNDDVGDLYRPPEAELREELPPRRWTHPPIAFAAGTGGLVWMAGDPSFSRLALFLVSALLAAVALAWFRRIAWPIAAVFGFVLSLAISMLISFIGYQLGF